MRAALDLRHDEAARCQWQSKRRGGTVSSGVLGTASAVTQNDDCEPSGRVGIAVRNSRAAAPALASLVAHWAYASLVPALRALGSACRNPTKRNPLLQGFLVDSGG